MDFKTTRIVVPDSVLMQEVGGEAVLLNLATEQYHGLDMIGTRMWQALVESDTLQQAYEILLAEYDVEASQLQTDLINFVNELSASELVTIHDA